MPRRRCSIVIRACNEEKHIGRLLTGITRQTFSDVEIILVDSGSTDSTMTIASRFPVHVLHFPNDDFTFGRSLSFGIEHAAGELMAMASAHVYRQTARQRDHALFRAPRLRAIVPRRRRRRGRRGDPSNTASLRPASGSEPRFMTLVDISVSLQDAMTMWPDSVGFRLARTRSFANGDSVTVSRVDADVHPGTHIDAPAHFLPGGALVDTSVEKRDEVMGSNVRAVFLAVKHAHPLLAAAGEARS